MINELEQKISESVEKYACIGEKYKSFQSIIGLDHTEELVNFSKEFKRKIAINIEKDRNLRIGIVGQMKAGKSSFLNALLFDGKDLLPKAATPMTAALTRILYSEKPRAVVEFYTEEEWEVVEKSAERYDDIMRETRERIVKEKEARENSTLKVLNILVNNAKEKKEGASNASPNRTSVSEEETKIRARIPVEIKAAKELYEMAEKNGLYREKHKYLGKEQVIEDVTSLEDLVGKLNNYVGAGGMYTPIVKSSRLYINDESLKNIEVIDTPGVNDPILSRGMATKKFLAECDVVFLLSYAGQFMDSSDVGYLIEKLPNEGIKNIILLGSKFDSALLDEGDKYNQNIMKALRGISLKLKQQAETIISPLKDNDPNNEIYKNIEKSMPPQFISSMAYNMSKHFDSLNEEERHILKRLQITFNSANFTPEFLRDLANIDNIRDKEFPRIINEKDVILSEKFQALLEGQRRDLKSKLTYLKEESQNKLENLSNGDKESLNKKYNTIKNSTQKARGKVDIIFDGVITKIKCDFALLKTELKKASSQYSTISTKSDSYEESYEVSTSKWYKPWSWGGSETRYKTVEYSYANVYDAVENISKFNLKAQERLQNQLMNMFNLNELRNKLIEAIMGVFDLSDENFNEYEILNPVNKVINNISIPNIDFDSDKYEKKILSKFNDSTVKNDDVNKLKRKYKEVMAEILEDIRKTVDLKVEEVVTNLENTNNDFMNKIDTEVKESIEELKKQIADKDNYERLYKDLIKNLEEDISNCLH
ncbi:dynamin family protein [Clostridium tagluense]|uniref:dynamin family protein n=1 Tax=Clostridium tagluense TaxID=360422 RepID=UPI001CF4DB69|nr:dynamin family protein [Clostridium tagluense]MCB2300297.1 dynamin family protein [Clostridium tagluense]